MGELSVDFIWIVIAVLVCLFSLVANYYLSEPSKLKFAVENPVDDVPALVTLVSYWIEFDGHRGNAVAVTTCKALCALHGAGKVGLKVKLRDSHGVARSGKVVFWKYEALMVDIAVVQLDSNAERFPAFIPVSRQPVRLFQHIIFAGLQFSLANSEEAAVYGVEGSVSYIEPQENSALFRSTYHATGGLSGAGVIITVRDGSPRVVGVHVAAHDDTVSPPAIKKTKSGGGATADSVSELSEPLASSIHGHTAYCLICEAVRVDGLLEVLSE